VTVAPERVGGGWWSRAPVRRRGVLQRRPELLPVAVTAAGWLAVLLAPGHGHAHGAVLPSIQPGATVAMVAATMGLLAIPGARTVAACSAWWSGRAAVTLFVAAFVGTWAGLAVVIAVGVAVLTWAVPAGAVACLALLAAGAAQLDPGRARLVDACATPSRIRASGRGAVVDAARFGGVSALRCGRTCALAMGAMLAMPAAGPLMLLVMATLTGLALLDRTAPRHRRPYLAAGYAVVGAAVLI
jgi:hypothetical protein